MQVVTEASPYRPPPPLDYEQVMTRHYYSHKQRDEADLKAVLTGVLYTLLAVGIIALVVLTTFAAMATGAGDSRSDEADDFELIGDTDYGRPGGASGGGGGAGGSRGWLVITRRPAVPPRRPPAPIHPEDPPTWSTTEKITGGQPEWTTPEVPDTSELPYTWYTDFPATTTAPKPDGRHLAAQMINATLNWSFEPCNDFYNFVCSRFEGGKGVLDKINDYTQQAVREMLVNIVIPSSHQKATEKAAGLFRACTRLGSDSTYSEVPSLKRFLSRLGLDLSNMPYDPEFDILDRVTSLSFEFGLPIFVKFGMFKSPPEIQDYILEMRINIEDENWLRLKHQELSDTDLEGLYLDYLRDYDQSILDSRISQRIIASELIMRKFLYDLRLKKIFALTRTTVEMLGTLTEGSISKDQWVWVVQKYTSKILNATDPVLLWDNAPAVVGLLMDSKQMSRHDARILLGWTLVRRLLPLAHGTWFTKASKEWGGGEGYTYDFCYEIISSVMALALTQRYLNTFVPRNAVESARSVLTNVMDTMVNKIGNTSWIEDPVKTILLWKARDMALLTAYPDEYANETMVEKFYERFPDVDAEFFSPYVASRRLLTIRIFRRHANAILRPATPNALYGFQENIIKVYAGILQPPVYIEGAPAAINYGGLGQVAGHEMMHAYDVKGIALDQKGRPLDNLKPTASMRAYEEKVLCLRASYERAEPHSRARTTDHWIDSEGFADYTGLLLAHSAFQRLSVTEREEALPGILLTAQQLFFVAHCAKWCAPPSESPRRHPEQSYWPSRSRCIVPLQNMPEFADAYQCKPGDPLNPEERCSFW